MISQTTKTALKLIIGGAIVIFGTILIVALARGWRINFFSGQIDQTGLVLIGSDPSGAQIYINNKLTKNKTPYRMADVDPGEITIDLKKDGFRDWQKKASVYAQEVTFADYAWLLPKDLTIENSVNELQPRSMVVDDKRKKFAFYAIQPTHSIWVQNELNQKPQQAFIPIDKPDTPIISLQPVGFNSDGNKLLIRENTTQQGDYIALTLNGNREQVDITTSFAVEASYISFSPTDPSELFIIEKGVLRRLDLDSKTISAVIAENVTYLSISENRIYYIQSDKVSHGLWSLDPASLNKTIITDKLPSSTKYLIKSKRFNNKDQLAVLLHDSGELLMFTDLNNQPKSTTLAKNISDFIFNKSGRYLSLNQTGKMVTIDLELNRRYNFKTSLDGLTDWAWIDDEHMVFVAGKAVHLVDFDGQNNQILIDNARKDTAVSFGPDRTIGAISEKSVDNTQISAIHLHKK